MLDKVPILVAIFLGLLLFVAKMRFIFKVVQAKTDFSVFNFSLALRLLASGIELGKGLDMNLNTVHYITTRFWFHVLLACHTSPHWS